MLSKLSAVNVTRVETIATAVLSVETSGEGFFEITRDVTRFLDTIKARDGTVLLYLRHTSASLVIQENADADVRTDLVTALSLRPRMPAGCTKWKGTTCRPISSPCSTACRCRSRSSTAG